VATQQVRDVMVKRPKTLPVEATVADVRRYFDNPKVVNAVLVDGTAFVGVLEREDLSATAPESSPVRGLARRTGLTIAADAPMSEAIAMLDEHDERRIVVLGDDGETLVGLLCLDKHRTGFCQD
jgi:FOG: CBS domain